MGLGWGRRRTSLELESQEMIEKVTDLALRNWVLDWSVGGLNSWTGSNSKLPSPPSSWFSSAFGFFFFFFFLSFLGFSLLWSANTRTLWLEQIKNWGHPTKTRILWDEYDTLKHMGKKKGFLTDEATVLWKVDAQKLSSRTVENASRFQWWIVQEF